MLHVIAATLSLLLLAGTFGSRPAAGDDAVPEAAGDIEASQQVIEPDA